MEKPPGRHDPLTLAVLGGALALLAAMLLYLLLSERPRPESAPSWPLVERVRQVLREMAAEVRDDIFREREREKASSGARSPAQAVPSVAGAARQPSGGLRPPAGRTWSYAVTLEPPVWREATLTYRTVAEGEMLAVHADFRHAGGKMNFRLGSFVPGHASHANTRFPGFFLYAAYIDFPVAPGQQVSWSWPWQLPDGGVREGRVKRFVGEVAGWESVEVPAGSFEAIRVAMTLSYMDEGRVQASVREALWLAPAVAQVVKVVREGRSPDESARHIVAELAEFR